MSLAKDEGLLVDGTPGLAGTDTGAAPTAPAALTGAAPATVPTEGAPPLTAPTAAAFGAAFGAPGTAPGRTPTCRASSGRTAALTRLEAPMARTIMEA